MIFPFPLNCLIPDDGAPTTHSSNASVARGDTKKIEAGWWISRRFHFRGRFPYNRTRPPERESSVFARVLATSEQTQDKQLPLMFLV